MEGVLPRKTEVSGTVASFGGKVLPAAALIPIFPLPCWGQPEQPSWSLQLLSSSGTPLPRMSLALDLTLTPDF